MNFFTIAFRSQFFLAALSAFLMPALWVSYYTGHSGYSGGIGAVVAWHGYEMFAGFSSALVAGFLLTASSNWAGIRPINGWPLVTLFVAWIAEHTLLLIPGIPNAIIISAHLLYALIFLILLFLQLKTNPRNFRIFIPWLLVFLGARFFYLCGALYEQAVWVAKSRVLMEFCLITLIVIITGRIVPFFMQKRIDFRPNLPAWLELSSILSVLLVGAGELASLEALILQILYGVASGLHLIRLLLWQPWRALAEPMLWILHLAYLALVLFFLAGSLPALVHGVGQVKLHIFTTGVLGLFAIGMMTRVSLGHTGRAIRSDIWILLMFACVLIGAALRIVFPVLFAELYTRSLHYSSGFWTLGFGFYLIRFTRILFSRRPDEVQESK